MRWRHSGRLASLAVVALVGLAGPVAARDPDAVRRHVREANGFGYSVGMRLFGRKVGAWRVFDKAGRLNFTYQYDDSGRKDGKVVQYWFCSSGKMKGQSIVFASTTYRIGERHGPYLRGDCSGIVTIEGRFDNGSRSGTWSYYQARSRQSGRRKYKQVAYVCDVPVTIIEFKAEGQAVQKATGRNWRKACADRQRYVKRRAAFRAKFIPRWLRRHCEGRPVRRDENGVVTWICKAKPGSRQRKLRTGCTHVGPQIRCRFLRLRSPGNDAGRRG